MLQLSAEDAAIINVVRNLIKASVPKGIKESISAYGMISYHIPHKIYPNGYHCNPAQPLPYVSLAAQKNYFSLYLFCQYVDADMQKWFVKKWKASGKKLNMGKGCVRFRSLEELDLNTIQALLKRMTLKRFISSYEKGLSSLKTRPKSKTARTSKRMAQIK